MGCCKEPSSCRVRISPTYAQACWLCTSGWAHLVAEHENCAHSVGVAQIFCQVLVIDFNCSESSAHVLRVQLLQFHDIADCCWFGRRCCLAGAQQQQQATCDSTGDQQLQSTTAGVSKSCRSGIGTAASINAIVHNVCVEPRQSVKEWWALTCCNEAPVPLPSHQSHQNC